MSQLSLAFTIWHPNRSSLKFCSTEFFLITKLQRGDIGECRLRHNLAYRSDYERARAKNPRLFFEFDVSTLLLLNFDFLL